jgi:hypothetical protein
MQAWAIVVGINVYPDQAKQNPLHGAVADACDFADWALDPGGGNVRPDRLHFWTYPWPENPTGRLQNYLQGQPPLWDHAEEGAALPNHTRPPKAFEITTTIEAVGRSERGRAKEDGDTETRRVYVFLAGHGIRAKTGDRTDETCYLAGDFRPLNSNLAGGLVPCDSFRRALLNGRFDEAIVFTDCCRSQTARLTLQAQQVSDYSGLPTEPFSLAFAAQDNMLAYETATQPVRGAFSSALMRGLRTHRAGAAGELHAAPLRQYVIDNIKDFTASGQVPNMSFQPDPDGPLIVAGGLDPAALPPPGRTVDVTALTAGTQLILKGGDNQPIVGTPQLVVAGPTIELPALPPGLYLLEVADGSGRYAVFKHPSMEAVRVG